MEEVILGAMMIDKKGVNEVIDILHPEAFYREAHKLVYEAILQLFNQADPIDLMSVSSQLEKTGRLDAVGGNFYLVQLTKKVSSSAHIEYYARIVIQKFLLRTLISVSSEVIEKSYDETTDVLELLDTTETKLYEVTQGNLKRNSETASNLVSQAVKRIQEMSKKEGVSGVPSGFSRLDSLTSGWQSGDLIVIAARPGMGKTALSLSMARNMAIKSGAPVAVFSLEMSSVQLITRLISSETGLSSEKLRTGKLEKDEWRQLESKIKNLESAPLYIDDTPSLSIFELRAKARRLASQQNIKLIMIDYLQLMTVGSTMKPGNREQEISTISRNLKALAKELDIPIIALSQLSRAVETRTTNSKRPQLSDLRESGAIEQDADIVAFIYRPEYYGIEIWDDDEQMPTKNQAEIIVAKHRNGGLDKIKLSFAPALGKFEDLYEVLPSKMNLSENNAGDPPTRLTAYGSPGHAFDDSSDVPF